jgi:hypothetical protein
VKKLWIAVQGYQLAAWEHNDTQSHISWNRV